MEPILETRGVNRNFGAVIAAADITVQVAEREVVGLIGSNGAGKTTFVNLVTGYLKPSSGQILYRGRDITALPPRAIARSGIRRSFQVPQLFAELSVLDNLLVALGAEEATSVPLWRPLQRQERIQAADRLLEGYGIASYRDHRAGLLPQGVRKLLDIAMATVGEPRLLLLDEPTSGVSVEEKTQIMDTLMAALAARAVTVLFVEHDMEIVERHARRVIAFYDGQIIADDTPARVFADADVQQYVVGSQIHRAPAPGGA